MADQKRPISVLRNLWPYIKPYRMRLFAALAALLVTTAINASIGQGLRVVIDQGLIAQSLEVLNQALIIMVAVVVVLAVATYLRFYWVTSLGEYVTADIRRSVFRHLVTLHPSYFEENRSGEIMSRLTTDTTLLQSIIGSSVSFALRSFLTMLVGIVMLLITNIKLTAIVLLSVPIVLLPIIIYGKRVRELSKSSQDRIADVGTYAGEIIQQMKVVQSYHRQDFENQAFNTEVDAALDVAKARIRQRAALIAVAISLSFIAIGFMVWIGGRDVMTGAMSGGELAAFLFYAVMVAMGVASISEIIGELQRAAGATERLMELLAVESDIQSPQAPLAPNFNAPTHVSFDQVNFSYPSRPNEKALNALTLAIARNETVALVGPSGAGKSTLFELLLRFYDPQQGSIAINQVDVREQSLADIRQHIALVPQQPVLFSADVWHNIRYGNPNASDEQVLAAAKAANAHEFIERLPEGYGSYLGENGVRLSGGQKQRIVIARAILANPELLLLDEATSALDAQSEHLVQQALEKLMQGRTTIIIAHRLATVKNVDRILLLQDGELKAQGSHNELMQSSELYAKLASLQFNEQATPEKPDLDQKVVANSSI
ncbi:ABC transporter transmembrane domain-containing protein [Salinibius halmophilus]|uniref:ABC transporter transmembrane domain-containing protein n=1 Tax=Salinibius halmophilus TaxID=1853216 RepID=UPI000E6696F4|nr:ABC transporter transmembrane domain-containing protein [Salinibius halmophilus]